MIDCIHHRIPEEGCFFFNVTFYGFNFDAGGIEALYFTYSEIQIMKLG